MRDRAAAARSRRAQLCLCWGPDARDPAALPARVRARRASRAHPSLYDRALPEVQFFDRLSRLLRAGGCHEFGFRDLAAPQAKRFKRQLSALINFLMHREDHIGLLTQALDEVRRGSGSRTWFAGGDPGGQSFVRGGLVPDATLVPGAEKANR